MTPRGAAGPVVMTRTLAVLVAAAMLLPVAYLLYRGLEAGPELWQLLWRPRTGELLLNTVTLTGAVTLASILLSVPLGWLVTRSDLPWRRFWSVVMVVPLAIPSYVGAYTLIAALGPRGMAQQLLGAPLGLERLPEIYGFPGAFLSLTLFTFPYVLLNVRAALLHMDPRLEEAARIAGAGQRATFLQITLPQLKPAITAGALLVALYTISDFGAVSFMRYDTFTRAIYIQYLAAFDRTYAAGLALVLVALSGLILLLEAGMRGRSADGPGGPGGGRPPVRVPLGRWRWPALLLCALTCLASLALPVTVITYWLVRGLAAGQTFAWIWTPLFNSIYVSTLAAGLAVVLALPVAIVAVRQPGALAALTERATYVGYALPGIVIALALVFFGIHVARPLYQTLALLIFAYLVRFLPQAVGSLRTSLLQVNPRLEEAAVAFGGTPWRVLHGITLPLLRPGIVSGAALVFLTVIKELPATLLLSPTGFRTLTTTIWGATLEGFYTQAAVPALVLLAAAGASVLLLLQREAVAGEGGFRGPRRLAVRVRAGSD